MFRPHCWHWLAFVTVISRSVTLCRASLLVGLVTKDAAVLSSTSDFIKNGVAMRADYDWIRPVGAQCLVGLQGDSSDCNHVMSLLESANREHELMFADRPLSCKSIAYLFRRIVAVNLRSGQLRVCGMVAGWDTEKGRPTLYWLDSIGSVQEVPYGAHGDEFPFVWSLLDRKNSGTVRPGPATATATAAASAAVAAEGEGVVPAASSGLPNGFHTLSLDAAATVIDSCMAAARQRTSGRVGSYRIKCVTATGHRTLPSTSTSTPTPNG